MIPRSILFGIGVIAAMFVAGLIALVLFQQPYQPHSVGGAFAMTEMTGRPVIQRDLLGRPTAVAFGFTYCPEVCPTTLSMLTQAMGRMCRDADKLNVVFVTVDPERDTAAQMRLYLSSSDPRIRGFTGTAAQVAGMADAYQVVYRRVPTTGGSYTMDHTAGVMLFNKDGRVVGQIQYNESVKRAFAKLSKLVQPESCIPGGPPRVDLWHGATLEACSAS